MQFAIRLKGNHNARCHPPASDWRKQPAVYPADPCSELDQRLGNQKHETAAPISGKLTEIGA